MAGPASTSPALRRLRPVPKGEAMVGVEVGQEPRARRSTTPPPAPHRWEARALVCHRCHSPRPSLRYPVHHLVSRRPHWCHSKKWLDFSIYLSLSMDAYSVEKPNQNHFSQGLALSLRRLSVSSNCSFFYNQVIRTLLD